MNVGDVVSLTDGRSALVMSVHENDLGIFYNVMTAEDIFFIDISSIKID